MAGIHDFEPVWGEWYIEKKLGKGGFGRVYKAYRDDGFGQRSYSAIKHISIPENAEDAEELAKRNPGKDIKDIYKSIAEETEHEIKAMSLLSGNTNIVTYQDHKIVPQEDGAGYDIFIRMELLTDLYSVTGKASITEKQLVKLALDICTALEVCAGKGIAHRDISPDNIFVSADGPFKLGDFGVSRVLDKTASGLTRRIGKEFYMAPEVANSKGVYGPGIDIYSLGMVLYVLTNGSRYPFMPLSPGKNDRTEEAAALVRLYTGKESVPAPAFANEALAEIILKMIAFDKRRRYKTAAEVKSDLHNLNPTDNAIPMAVSDGREMPGAVADTKKPKKRAVIFVIAVLIVFSALAVVLILGGNKDGSTAPPSTPAAASPASTEAAPIPEETIKTGDTLHFSGTDWQVLTTEGDNALVISKMILELKAYNTELTDMTWENSTIRDYLNNDFYNNNFIEAEKAAILETEVVNNGNPWFGADGGNNTTDKIFLLSVEEVIQYFGDSGDLKDGKGWFAIVSDDGQTINYELRDGQGWMIHDRYDENRTTSMENVTAFGWWLRTPGLNAQKASTVQAFNGMVSLHGGDVDLSVGGVRPAFWLNTKALPQFVTDEEYWDLDNNVRGAYTGYWADNQPNGTGTWILEDGSSWEGHFANGLPDGQCKSTTSEGFIFEGNFENWRLTGKGTITAPNGTLYYEGDFLNGLMNGYGRMEHATGDIYEGDFVDSHKNGFGTMHYSDGTIYEGQFKNDQRNGEGKFTWTDGEIYEGNYVDGLPHGQGKYTYPDGTSFEDEWVNGIPQNHDVFTFQRMDTVNAGEED